MPFFIENISYSDEFNSGVRNVINSGDIQGNVSDELEFLIDINYSNIIDASRLTTISVTAENSIFEFGSVAGFQTFVLNNMEFIFAENIAELRTMIGSEFETSGFTDPDLNDTWTIKAVITSQNSSTGATVTKIICNEVFVNTELVVADAKIEVSEPITTCNFDFKLSGRSTENFIPYLKIGNPNDNIFANITGSGLDASDTVTEVALAYTNQGAYISGNFKIVGRGFTDNVQKFRIKHKIIAAPITLNFTPKPTDFSDFNTNSFNKTEEFTRDTDGYIIKGFFGNQPSGGLIIPFETLNRPYIRLGGTKAGGAQQQPNGQTSAYDITNVSIVRVSDSENSGKPLINEKYRVLFSIENATTTPFVTLATKIKAGVEFLPENIDDVKDDDNYIQTFLYDRAITTINTPILTGLSTGNAACITRFEPTFVSNSRVDCILEIEYNAGAKTFITQSSNYYISIFAAVQDHTKTYTNSDRVVLEVFKGLGQLNIPIDPVDVQTTTFVTHRFDSVFDGVTSNFIDGHPVQDLVGATRFSIDWSGRDALRFNRINQKIVLKNAVSGQEIEVENYSLPLQSFPLINNKYPQVDETIVRGYKIPPTEIRNQVRIFNDAASVGDLQYFQVYFPFFIRWEEYRQLLLTEIPSELIDNTKPFNGINFFLHRYDTIADWDVFYRVNFECSESGFEFSQDYDYQLNTVDYEANVEILTRAADTFSNDGTIPLIISTEPAIDLSQKTKIVAEWQLTYNPIPTDIDVIFWAEQKDNGSPTQIDRISSVNDLFSGSMFENENNNGKVEITVVDDVVTAVAYFNPDQIINITKIRLYCVLITPVLPSGIKTMADGSGKKTSDDFYKTIG